MNHSISGVLALHRYSLSFPFSGLLGTLYTWPTKRVSEAVAEPEGCLSKGQPGSLHLKSEIPISFWFLSLCIKFQKRDNSHWLSVLHMIMYVSMLLYTSYPLLPPLHSVPISLFSMSACISIQFSSVQSLSRVRLFAIPWISARQASLSITISWSLLKLRSIESLMPSSHLILCHPLFSSCPQSLPASESLPMSQLFAWGGQSTEVPALATFLPKNTQGWSPCSPRDSQEPSPTPQFKSISSSALSFLHSPTLTSIHDHWKNHSLD